MPTPPDAAPPGELSGPAAEVSAVLCYPFNCQSEKELHEAVRAAPARSRAARAHRCACAAVRRRVELAELPRDAGQPAEPQPDAAPVPTLPSARAQHALDQCVEAGERRRFRVESSCRRWRRIYQSCGLHGDLDCSRQLEWLRDCIRSRARRAAARSRHGRARRLARAGRWSRSRRRNHRGSRAWIRGIRGVGTPGRIYNISHS